MVLVPEVVDAVGPDVPVLAAGGIGDGRQMAAALALGAQGVWTGSIWLTVAEADTQPEVTENLLGRDVARHRALARDDGQARPAAAHRVDRGVGPARGSPTRCRCRCRASCTRKPRRRFTRVHTKEFAGFPVGQIVGSIDRVRPAREVVLDMVEGWISTVEGMRALADGED